MSTADETLDLMLEDANDVRPVIATGSASNLGLYAFIVLLGIGGLILFNALNSSRETGAAEMGRGERIASPEPLEIPGAFGSPYVVSPEARGLSQEEPYVFSAEPSLPSPGSEQPPVRVSRVANPINEMPTRAVPSMPQFLPQPPQFVPPPDPTRETARSQVVYERTAPKPTYDQLLSGSEGTAGRVKAGRLENPSLTIPQGTVIPAVLETALDSTRGGGVRALVQRNVMGFDGKKVLIPRGSRLYGEYQADLKRGQNRALVQWTRLIRPDGVTIALDSPSSDPLGRAGVKGKVDSKFFQRFGNALLQSVLDIGVGLAVNSASDGVILALPGSTQNVQISDPNEVLPSLKVKHGTSVSVFVARDLDFSSVDS